MKNILFLVATLVSLVATAQLNIGIGETSPSAKLTIKGSETTPDGQNAAIRLQNSASANSWYIRAGATGTTTPAGGLSIADNTGYHLNILSGGNIGIGINSATARLHINGSIKIEGLNIMEFGSNVAGKEVNAGKIGYNAFGQSAMTFVGGGTTSANRAFYFYAEGGTTFNGPLNIGGNLNRPVTGGADLVPLAYGLVDGTQNPPVILNGTGNFSVVRSGAGFYTLTVAGETLTDLNHTAIASCVRNSITGGTFIWTTASTSPPVGNLYVLTGNASDQKFSFVIYKP